MQVAGVHQQLAPVCAVGLVHLDADAGAALALAVNKGIIFRVGVILGIFRVVNIVVSVVVRAVRKNNAVVFFLPDGTVNSVVHLEIQAAGVHVGKHPVAQTARARQRLGYGQQVFPADLCLYGGGISARRRQLDGQRALCPSVLFRHHLAHCCLNSAVEIVDVTDARVRELCRQKAPCNNKVAGLYLDALDHRAVLSVVAQNDLPIFHQPEIIGAGVQLKFARFKILCPPSQTCVFAQIENQRQVRGKKRQNRIFCHHAPP